MFGIFCINKSVRELLDHTSYAIGPTVELYPYPAWTCILSVLYHSTKHPELHREHSLLLNLK